MPLCNQIKPHYICVNFVSCISFELVLYLIVLSLYIINNILEYIMY